MIVVDIEASGTDPLKHSIVSIGAINFKNPEVQFYKECKIWNEAHIDPAALEIIGMNEEQLRDQSKQSETEIVKSFIEWAEKQDDHMFAGINPLFDIGFIKGAARRGHLNYPFADRSVDLHSLMYFELIAKGKDVPQKNHHSGINSDFTMNYVGIPTEPKPHIALNGAIWEAEAFHRLFYKKPLLDQFKQYPIVF